MNRALSQSGQAVFLAALMVRAGTSDGAAIGLSGIFVAMMAATALCSLPCGAITDRIGAPRSLWAGILGRAIVIAVAMTLPASPAASFVIAFAYSAVSQLLSPAELALVPAQLEDGPYLLDLQVPAFAADAAPSRPVLYRLTEQSA